MLERIHYRNWSLKEFGKELMTLLNIRKPEAFRGSLLFFFLVKKPLIHTIKIIVCKF